MEALVAISVHARSHTMYTYQTCEWGTWKNTGDRRPSPNICTNCTSPINGVREYCTSKVVLVGLSSSWTPIWRELRHCYLQCNPPSFKRSNLISTPYTPYSVLEVNIVMIKAYPRRTKESREEKGGQHSAGFPWPQMPLIGHQIPNPIALRADIRRLSGTRYDQCMGTE